MGSKQFGKGDFHARPPLRLDMYRSRAKRPALLILGIESKRRLETIHNGVDGDGGNELQNARLQHVLLPLHK